MTKQIFSRVLATICGAFFLMSCEPFNLPLADIPTPLTGEFVKDDNFPGGIAMGSIIGLAAGTVDEHGHIWSMDPEPNFENEISHSSLGRQANIDTFKSEILEVIPNSIVYYRTYLIFKNHVRLGEVKQFGTSTLIEPESMEIDLPSFNEGRSGLRLTARIKDLPEGLEITSYGIVYGPNPEPNRENDLVILREGIKISKDDAKTGLLIEADIVPNGGLNYFRPFFEFGTTFYGKEIAFKVGDFWESTQAFQLAINTGEAFSMNGKGYLFVPVGKSFWEFDPNEVGTNKWKKRANLPENARVFQNSVGFGLEISPGKWRGYLGMGNNGPNDYSQEFWEFNPSDGELGTWRKVASFNSEGRNTAVAFTIGNKAYVGTGFSRRDGRTIRNNDLIRFSPPSNQSEEGMWEDMEPLPAQAGNRAQAVAFAIEGKGYISAGRGDNRWREDTWQFDPNLPGKGGWTRMSDLPGLERTEGVGFAIADRGYIGTGIRALVHKDFWEFRPIENTWTRKTELPGTARFKAIGFAVGGKGYIGLGGSDGVTLNDMWEYVPD